ncbi:hypothetical protein D3C71_1548090 [compost metagenome]
MTGIPAGAVGNVAAHLEARERLVDEAFRSKRCLLVVGLPGIALGPGVDRGLALDRGFVGAIDGHESQRHVVVLPLLETHVVVRRDFDGFVIN